MARGTARPRPGDWPEDRIHAAPWPLHAVAGIDEAGRGPLAGPVVAAAVVLATDDPNQFPGLDDSKKLSPELRNRLYHLLQESVGGAVVGIGTGLATAGEIDRTDILRATELAAARALSALPVWPERLLTDALNLRTGPWQGRQVPLVKGDGRCLCIAAASVVAKVTRDRMMAELDRIHPQYGFARNVGYPTAEHYRSLETHGPCAAHRKSFLKPRG